MRSLYLKQWFSYLALFTLLPACNDNSSYGNKVVALLEKKWVQMMPEIPPDVFTISPETLASQLKNFVAKKQQEGIYEITLGQYKSGDYVPTLRNKVYKPEDDGRLTAVEENASIKEITLEQEEDDFSHITVRWKNAKNEEYSMKLFQGFYDSSSSYPYLRGRWVPIRYKEYKSKNWRDKSYLPWGEMEEVEDKKLLLSGFFLIKVLMVFCQRLPVMVEI